MRAVVAIGWAGLILTGDASAQTKAAKPDDTPTFHLRARIVSQAGKEPTGKKFTFQWAVSSPALALPGKPATASGSEWSDWLRYGDEQVATTLERYPAIVARRYPVVIKLQTNAVVDPTRIEAELKFDERGEAIPLSGELFGPSLGILISREEKKPRAATMAGYNRRYWKLFENVQVPKAQRPKHFPIVERFVGDDDRNDWREGIEQLARRFQRDHAAGIPRSA
jgi:hypothetical protein